MRVVRASSIKEYASWYLRREARKRKSDLKDSKSGTACLELGSLALAGLLLIASYGRAVR